MNRLTNRNRETKEAYLFDAIGGIDKAIEKLAQYEDAEDQKRIIVLPCKVGDYVFYHFQFRDKRILPFTRNAKVVSIKALTNSMNLTIEVELMDSKEKGVRRHFKISDFGKIVFTTRDEAEKALSTLTKEAEDKANESSH